MLFFLATQIMLQGNSHSFLLFTFNCFFYILFYFLISFEKQQPFFSSYNLTLLKRSCLPKLKEVLKSPTAISPAIHQLLFNCKRQSILKGRYQLSNMTSHFQNGRRTIPKNEPHLHFVCNKHQSFSRPLEKTKTITKTKFPRRNDMSFSINDINIQAETKTLCRLFTKNLYCIRHVVHHTSMNKYVVFRQTTCRFHNWTSKT